MQRRALQMLAESEVGFASVTENFDFTTPAGRLMLTMMGSVSEFFSDQLGVHVSKAKRERAEMGLHTGPVPFGYRTPDGPRSTPTIEPSEAALVRDLPGLWAAATRDEKHRMVRLLFERVYVDLETKQVTAIVPTAEFGFLLGHALEAADRGDIMLVPVEDVDALDALHAYIGGERMHEWTSGQPGDAEVARRLPSAGKLEMVETGEN